MVVFVSRLPFALHPLVAEAKRRMRRRRLLLLVLALVIGAGAAGATSAIYPSSGAVRPAGACPVTGGYYAYAVPDNPAHPPAADSGPTNWGWTPRHRQLRAGNWMRVGGHLWRVTEIAAMPGVEPVGRPFGIMGWPMPGQHVPGNAGLTMCGRLVFQPVT
jgi:hypothetical protein